MAKLRPKGKFKIADNVKFSKKAVKGFNNYDAKVQKAIIETINEKAKNLDKPVDHHDRKLKAPDHNGEYRLDVRGKYRITYDIKGKELLVNMVTVRGNTGWSES